jgi:hypothetical protein
MKTKLLVLLACAACISLFLAACKEKGSRTLGSYFEAKSDYATVLDDWLGQSNPNWRVIPIYGPIYEPGTPMEPGSTEPLTDSCLVPVDKIIDDDMATFPSISASRKFDISADIPDAIAKAKALAASGGAVFGISSESELSYQQMSQRAVRRDVFDQNLMRLDCLTIIAGKEVTIVRGLITGQEVISSQKRLSTSATVEVMSDEALKVSYDSSGGYRLEDTEAHPKYYYVVNRTIQIDIPPDATMTMRRAIIEDYLRTESTGELDFVDRRPTDGQVESFVQHSRAGAD